MIPMDLFSVSGNEAPVTEYLKTLLGGECDNLGNLLVKKPGSGKKTAIACPIDENGLFVTDASGKISFALIGKEEPSTLINRTVIFKNGTKGIICGSSDSKLSDLYIEADGKVCTGDIARYSAEQLINGEKIVGFSVERSLCAKAVMQTMELLKATDLDITYIFTTMYKIGKKGLNAALLNGGYDYTVVIDTVSGDNIKCGDGAVVKITDGSYTADTVLHSLAREKGVKMTVCKDPQIRAANSISSGALTGYISIPVEKVGGIIKGSLSDAQSCAELASELVTRCR